MRDESVQNSSGKILMIEDDIREIAYEAEETITDILSKKLVRALDHTGAKLMCLA
jgi:tRNA A37 threonylcarbamoyltransferase TsaD